MIRALVLGLVLQAGPTLADPLSAADFDAYVTGKTLQFDDADGNAFGVETYGPDRSVIWSSGQETCQTGRWFDRGDQICFTYDTDPLPKCWIVTRTDGRLRAESPFGTVLYESPVTPPRPVCAGPELLS